MTSHDVGRSVRPLINTQLSSLLQLLSLSFLQFKSLVISKFAYLMCNIYNLRCDAILVRLRFVSLVCQSAKPIGSTFNRLLFSLVHTMNTMNLYVDVLYVTVFRSPCMYLCVSVSEYFIRTCCSIRLR